MKLGRGETFCFRNKKHFPRFLFCFLQILSSFNKNKPFSLPTDQPPFPHRRNAFWCPRRDTSCSDKNKPPSFPTDQTFLFVERSERSKKVRVSGARGEGGVGTFTCGSVKCLVPVEHIRRKTTHEENHRENTTETNKPGPRWEAPGPPPWVPGPPSPLLCHREMLRWAPILPSSGPCGHPRALAHPPQAIRGLVS